MSSPVAHTWSPLEDLPPGWQTLTSGELRALSEVWFEQKDELATSGALDRFNERLRVEWAIETGVIERIYSLDRGTTELLIQRGVVDASLIPREATDKDPELVARIIGDQEAAVDWLFDVVRGRRELSLSFVKELHALMTRHQPTAPGRDQFGREAEIPLLHGEWKRHPNNPTRPDGSVHEYCPPEQVGPEMERLVTLHLQHEAAGVAPEVEAAWLHHRFTQVHPFQDGNGRIARALASLVFIRAGWFPLVVTRDDRERYINALEDADRGDLAPLVELFVARQRKSFVDALSIAGEAALQDERVKDVVTSIVDLYADRLRQVTQRREWGHAKEIADRVVERGRQRFASLAGDLAAELGRFSPDFQFVVDHETNDGARRRWFASQTLAAARELDYVPNLRAYRAWVRLDLRTDTRAEILLSLTAVGREYRGVIGAALLFVRRPDEGDAEEHVIDLATASDELFQVNYMEPPGSALDRFDTWLDRSLVRALARWRETL